MAGTIEQDAECHGHNGREENRCAYVDYGVVRDTRDDHDEPVDDQSQRREV